MSRITSINTLAELERLGITWEEGGENEIRVVCPFHEDSTPSCCINTEKNVYICQASSCKNSGDIISFIARVVGANRRVVYQELASRYNLEDKKVIDPHTVEAYFKNLSGKKTLLAELSKRGVGPDLVREARLGEFKGRITIPIYEDGEVVNIRHYLPGAPGSQKFRNHKGFGKKLRLYRREDIGRYDRIWIHGGELKALAASPLLNEIEVGSVSPSGGEGSWDRIWDDLFKGKKVYVCMDVDLAGLKASVKIATFLYGKCEVYIVKLPLDKTEHPKGDINDYIFHHKPSAEDFEKLMSEAQQYTPEAAERNLPDEDSPESVSFLDALRSGVGNKVINFPASIVALDETPYQIPEVVAVSCDRAQKCCHECPILGLSLDEDAAYSRVHLPMLHPSNLQMAGSNVKLLRLALYDSIGIPHACRVVRFKIDSHRNLYDARISPVMDFHVDEDPETAVQQAFVFTNKLSLNSPYSMTGVMTPHPKNQKATFIVKRAVQSEDTLEDFSLTPELHEQLLQFQPKQWTVQGISEQLARVYEDLSCNVTRIFERPEIHSLIDLTYHSVIGFEYRGRTQNGWINCLIVGDSSLGKSEASSRLHEHYRLGTRLDCRSASFAGIVGGVQQFDGGQYYISWGVIPKNDRGMVILDEAKGLREETIGRMTDMRSSGWAEIPKIEHRRAPARTRLLWITNPRRGALDDYAYGVSSVLEFCGSPEATRRFDIVGVFARDDSIDIYGQVDRKVEHVFTQDLCRNLILFAWSRSSDQIKINNVELAEESATKLRETFIDDIPIVDTGSIHLKLLRVACAFAARTYSVDFEGNIVVRDCHILYAEKFLMDLYSNIDCAYDEFSRVRRMSKNITNREEVVHFILNDVTEVEAFFEGLLNTDAIHREDIEDWCGVDGLQARNMIGFLTRQRCLIRNDRWTYKKSAEFTKLLRKIEPDIPKIKPEKPDL